jgi:CheY-like chemotaxis protein
VGILHSVLLPLVLNLGSDRITARWDRYRSERSDWTRILATEVTRACPGNVFRAGDIEAWLADPHTMVGLVAATEVGLKGVSQHLVNSKIGSPLVGPAVAQADADLVVAAAISIVLDCAPEDDERLIAGVLRIVAQSQTTLDAVTLGIEAIKDAQELQDRDLLQILEILRCDPERQITTVNNAPIVLFVDDQPWVLAGLTAELTGRGYCVQSAHTVSSAIDILSVESVAVVVIDLVIPEYPLRSVINDDTESQHLFSRVVNERGGIKLLRLLPQISRATVPIVWTAFRGSDDLGDVLCLSKLASHARLITAITDIVRPE